jgi:hypothetical protein
VEERVIRPLVVDVDYTSEREEWIGGAVRAPVFGDW